MSQKRKLGWSALFPAPLAAAIRGAGLSVPLAWLLVAPAEAHRCFKIWRYHTPQHCGAAHVDSQAPAEDRSWYVELILPEPLPMSDRERALTTLRSLLPSAPKPQ